MKSHKSILILLALVFSFSILTTDNIYGQRKYDDTEYEPTNSLRDRLFVGAYLNSPYFSGNSFGSQFGVGLQPFVGYKLNEFISAGFTVKFDYAYFYNQSGNTSLTDFASTVFTRGTIAEQFILQIEGGYYSHQTTLNSSDKVRYNFPVAYAGIGYRSGATELLLSYEITGNLFPYRIPFEYKIGIIFDF